MLTLAQAQNAINAHINAQNNAQQIAQNNAQQIAQLLSNASVTFAQIVFVTQVQCAAKHKNERIYKVTSANVMLCANVNASTNVYARAVRKSAKKFTKNEANAIQDFAVQQTYYTRTQCYSIVQNNKTTQMYLQAFFNNAKSIYLHNNVQVNKQYVAQYMTPSAANALLNKTNVVHNKANNITHDVCVRTIMLQNIISVKARKKLLLLNT